MLAGSHLSGISTLFQATSYGALLICYAFFLQLLKYECIPYLNIYFNNDISFHQIQSEKQQLVSAMGKKKKNRDIRKHVGNFSFF